MTDCGLPGCPKQPKARGLCNMHLQRHYRGDPLDEWIRGKSGDQTLSEYDWLTENGVTFVDIAGKLNLKPASLARTLARAGRPVPRGVGAWDR